MRTGPSALTYALLLQVARCTKIINPNTDDAKYMINVKQIAKFVVGLGDRVAPADIEEGMRVGVDRNKYQIQIPLPPKIDPTVTMMTVEEKPDITYNDIGGNKEEIQKLREVLELPMLHPERFVQLGIDPPKGILLFGPPGASVAVPSSRDCACSSKAFLISFRLRDGKDIGCTRCCQSHRCLLHSCDRLGACAKVRGRGGSHGARAIPNGSLQEGMYRLLG